MTSVWLIVSDLERTIAGKRQEKGEKILRCYALFHQKTERFIPFIRFPMKLRCCIVYKFQCQRCDALYLAEPAVNCMLESLIIWVFWPILATKSLRRVFLVYSCIANIQDIPSHTMIFRFWSMALRNLIS